MINDPQLSIIFKLCVLVTILKHIYIVKHESRIHKHLTKILNVMFHFYAACDLWINSNFFFFTTVLVNITAFISSVLKKMSASLKWYKLWFEKQTFKQN